MSNSNLLKKNHRSLRRNNLETVTLAAQSGSQTASGVSADPLLPVDSEINRAQEEERTVPLLSNTRSLLKYRIGHFIVISPDGQRKEVSFDLPHIRIGSDSSNDLCLPDPAVSRFHCELRHSESGFVLRDLKSTNGTLVSGLAIKEAVVHAETAITVGRTSISFIPGNEERRVNASTEENFGAVVGRSRVMREIFGVLEKVAGSDLTVTLEGETGTGKDVTAQAIHLRSNRREGPFVVFDAGAVASNLIESELFGHEKGSFTGATEMRMGAFERANGGTLFIDEIGELALDLQPKLLRALEQREIQRVGGSRQTPVDVRVLCATNRNLREEVSKSRFREDLFFRISVVVLSLPRLSDRPEDIPPLVETFVREMDPDMHVSSDLMNVLKNYRWPGNVRELRNIIGAAATLCEGKTLNPRDMIFTHERHLSSEDQGTVRVGGRTLESIERSAISQTLDQYHGNRSAAARSLGIAPSTLYVKIKKYGLSF